MNTQLCCLEIFESYICNNNEDFNRPNTRNYNKFNENEECPSLKFNYKNKSPCLSSEYGVIIKMIFFSKIVII